MNNLYAVLAAAILSACAATPYVSDSNSELLKASALQFNQSEKLAVESCKHAGGQFDELTDGQALPLSMSIICKDVDPSKLDAFNAHSKTALENLGVTINNSRNGFSEKPNIEMHKSDNQVSWSISKSSF
jgi:hypothetical protein